MGIARCEFTSCHSDAVTWRYADCDSMGVPLRIRRNFFIAGTRHFRFTRAGRNAHGVCRLPCVSRAAPCGSRISFRFLRHDMRNHAELRDGAWLWRIRDPSMAQFSTRECRTPRISAKLVSPGGQMVAGFRILRAGFKTRDCLCGGDFRPYISCILSFCICRRVFMVHDIHWLWIFFRGALGKRSVPSPLVRGRASRSRANRNPCLLLDAQKKHALRILEPVAPELAIHIISPARSTRNTQRYM